MHFHTTEAALLLLLLSFRQTPAAPSQKKSDQCKKYVHSIYYMCHVTVFHLGDLPSVEDLDNNDRSRRALQPLLCPCPQGYTSWLCPSAVQEVLALFQHDVLCNSDEKWLDSNSPTLDYLTSTTTEDITNSPPTKGEVPENYDEMALQIGAERGTVLEKSKDYDTNNNAIGVD